MEAPTSAHYGRLVGRPPLGRKLAALASAHSARSAGQLARGSWWPAPGLARYAESAPPVALRWAYCAGSAQPAERPLRWVSPWVAPPGSGVRGSRSVSRWGGGRRPARARESAEPSVQARHRLSASLRMCRRLGQLAD